MTRSTESDEREPARSIGQLDRRFDRIDRRFDDFEAEMRQQFQSLNIKFDLAIEYLGRGKDA